MPDKQRDSRPLTRKGEGPICANSPALVMRRYSDFCKMKKTRCLLRGGIHLNKIAWYARCFLTSSIFCAAAFAAVIIMQPPNWKPYAILSLAAGLMTAFLFFTMSKKLKDARLIVENQILHIQPAVFREPSNRNESGIQPCETVEMFVSGFGILLGSKIIKFNREGIRLKAVEIGQDYLSIDYVTDAEARNIRLLHARPDSSTLAGIIEKFRYETGILPVVTE